MFGLKDNEKIYLRGYSDGFNNNHLNSTPRFIGPAFNLTSDSEAATVIKEFEITDTFESTDSYNVGFNDLTFVEDIKTKLNIVYNSIDGKTVNIDLSKALVPERTGLFDDGFMIISFKHNGKTYEFDYRNEMGYPIATGTVSDEKIGVVKAPSDWQLYSIDKEEIISTYYGKAITASGSNVVYIYPEWKNKVYTFTSVDSESYSINFDGITADKEHRTININCELAEWSGFGYQWQPYDGSRDFNVTVNLIGITEEYLSKKNLLDTVNNMKTYPGITVNFLPAEVIPPDAEDASLNWTYTVNDSDNSIHLKRYIGTDTDVIVKNKYLVDDKIYDNVIVGEGIVYGQESLFDNRKDIKSVSFEKGCHLKTLDTMFRNCSGLINVDFSSLDISSDVDTFSSAFYGCTSLKNVNFGDVIISNFSIDMFNCFNKCSSLESLDLSFLGNGRIDSFQNSFRNCSSLKTVNLSNFENIYYGTSYDNSMPYMFSECPELESVYVKNEKMKTDVEASSNFPATAQVIIGSPA